MKAAVIDIGTNTVRLLVAEQSTDGKWLDVVREVEIARLGEGVERSREINPQAMARTVAILEGYRDLIVEHGARKVRVVSTSAMRDAGNAADFIAMVERRLGLRIEVISGAEEGRFTFGGAASATLVPPGSLTLVVDVGGGSTEYIWGVDGSVLEAVSIDIGAVRLSELFFNSDPPAATELAAARAMIGERTEEVFERIVAAEPTALVAVAGTATQLAAVLYSVEPYDPAKIHGSRITRGELHDLVAKLASLDLDARKALTGMRPKRADVIIAGALILDETLERLGFEEMVISEHDILDGLVRALGDGLIS
ncbi:MAG: Ppx/GppA phosphatase family protein [Actinomycetota bacterium]|nr:Ppx/GppA phosphatase family protein [Actinomycetota bacterium]